MGVLKPPSGSMFGRKQFASGDELNVVSKSRTLHPLIEHAGGAIHIVKGVAGQGTRARCRRVMRACSGNLD